MVRGIPYRCWKCHTDDIAVALLHVDGLLYWDYVVPAEEDLALAYAADILRAEGHEQAETIKPRRSKTAKSTYLSNGCINCDALFGSFHVSEKVFKKAAAERLDELPLLTEAVRPLIEWHVLTGLRATSGMLSSDWEPDD